MAGDSTAFYAKEDVLQQLESIPDGMKSETVNNAIRQYFAGQGATREARITELIEEIDDIDSQINDLEAQQRDLETELEGLRAQAELEDEQTAGATEAVVDLFNTVVGVEPEDRLQHLQETKTTVPEETWMEVLDAVDIHCFVNGHLLHEEDVEGYLKEHGLYTDSALNGALSNEITDDAVAATLSKLTDAEREEVIRVAEAAE